MDPDANLTEQLRIVKRLLDSEGVVAASKRDGTLPPDALRWSRGGRSAATFRLAELVEGLNDWITKGGALPDDWRVA